jgi:hypothetical protein
LTTIAPPWSGYPTCSGFTPVFSPSPAPTRAVSQPKRRARRRGAIRAIPARPANHASTAIAKRVDAPPMAIAAERRHVSRALALLANAKRAAAASVTTRPPAPPTIGAASAASASPCPVRATGTDVPGQGEKSARGTPIALRIFASTAPAPPGDARRTKTARRISVTSGSVSLTSAARASRAPRVARAYRGSAFLNPPRPTDRPRAGDSNALNANLPHRRESPDFQARAALVRFGRVRARLPGGVVS